MRKAKTVNQTRNNAVLNISYKQSHAFHLNRRDTAKLEPGKLITGSACCGRGL